MGRLLQLIGLERREPARFIIATRQESLAAQRRRADKRLELAVYVATTSDDQRRADATAFFGSRSMRPSAGGRG